MAYCCSPRVKYPAHHWNTAAVVSMLPSNVNPAGTTRVFSYDADGNLARVTEEEGKFSYETDYDPDGYVMATRSSNGYRRECSYERDEDGTPTEGSVGK